MKLEVCIVDDDKMIALVHKKMILKSSFHADPMSFANGKEALDYILQNNVIDTSYCILLDINMPVMNGWQFLDAINAHQPESDIFIVVVTSSVDYADKQKAKSYTQVISFIEKPISLNLLEGLKKHDALKTFF